MNPNDPRLPAVLESAITLIQTTALSVAGRVSESLGAAAQSSARIAERDLLNSSQFELRRNMGTFHVVFKQALREKIDQDLAPRDDSRKKQTGADWQTLSLVGDHEVEERMFADRIGQLISHEADTELRELASYMGTLLGIGRADQDRNPLRADTLGTALYRAIESVSEQTDTRKLLARDLGSAMARAMPACYAQILRDVQHRGVQPVVLTVRGVDGPGHHLPGLNSAYTPLTSAGSQPGDFDPSSITSHDSASHGPAHNSRMDATSGYGRRDSRLSSSYAAPANPYASHTVAAPMPSTQGGGASTFGGRSRHGAAGLASNPADVQLMALLRRLTALASRPGDFDALERASGHGSLRGGGEFPGGSAAAGAYAPPHHHQHIATEFDPGRDPHHGAEPGHHNGSAAASGGMMAVNLIHAHREELVKASSGQLDHMVIDVVGSLFDQILSDARVPPQMARQIARLQLPVLRVALSDSSFFSSRRHPVRRFVNRIASLACAFDDFDDGAGQQFLERVRELVQEIVDGDFDQIEIYSAKLAALEGFIGEQTSVEVKKSGTAATLENKESELRIQQRFMQQLQEALQPIALPQYLRDFIPQVWSQALALASRRDGPTSDRAQRFRRAGRDLVMSVQPKGSPVLRKKFLMQLPPLMKDLNEGMQLIGWPEQAQREFFGKLMPAHAESLKGQPMSELDYNMMAKQLEAIFGVQVSSADAAASSEPLPSVADEVVAQRFSPEEARRVGLVQESSVDWSGQVDIDLSRAAHDDEAEALSEATESASLGLGLDIDLDLSAEPPEPMRGPQLIDHIKLGFAYQMHLKDEWQKVRLTHVSAGRSFFVFTRGKKHQETISMTSRMLSRMCETGRMRAVESAYLMERATHRARKQLAALRSKTRV
ncbi:hypothetical protein BH11PSE8_BH11PSE8_40660 [soil metagenome]